MHMREEKIKLMYTPQSLEYYLSKCRYYHGGDLMDDEIWGGYEKR